MNVHKSQPVLLIIILLTSAIGLSAQSKTRKRNVAKLAKTEISCSKLLQQETLCGPPSSIKTNAEDVGSGNTVTVQLAIDETGNVLSAKAVSGRSEFYAIALEDAKRRKFTPKRLSGKPVKVTAVIVYRFDDQ